MHARSQPCVCLARSDPGGPYLALRCVALPCVCVCVAVRSARHARVRQGRGHVPRAAVRAAARAGRQGKGRRGDQEGGRACQKREGGSAPAPQMPPRGPWPRSKATPRSPCLFFPSGTHATLSPHSLSSCRVSSSPQSRRRLGRRTSRRRCGCRCSRCSSSCSAARPIVSSPR